MQLTKKTLCPQCSHEPVRSTKNHGFCKTADYDCPNCKRHTEIIIELNGLTGIAGQVITEEAKKIFGAVSVRKGSN